jgi:hypothetical protein
MSWPAPAGRNHAPPGQGNSGLVVVEFNGSDVLALLEQLGERRIEFVASMKAWKTSPTSTFPTCAHRWR